jgi:deoxycytidylate deaminase
MGLAFIAAQRSHDEQTKHGCVLVDPMHHVIGVGFNGHIRGGKDTLPTTRPDKYPFMIHSEQNALANCVVPPWTVSGGVTAYITGRPCLQCSQILWQHHVCDWVIADRKGWTQPRPEEEAALRELEMDSKVKIRIIRPDLNWIFGGELAREVRELGFAH